MKYSNLHLLQLSALFPLILTSCIATDVSKGSSAAAEGYLQALAEKDVNMMINLSCAAWEAQAKQEFASFDAVDLTLENLQCHESGQDGEATLVACTGKMIASYRAGEILEIDVADRNYRIVMEGGEWRMCGYP